MATGHKINANLQKILIGELGKFTVCLMDIEDDVGQFWWKSYGNLNFGAIF